MRKGDELLNRLQEGFVIGDGANGGRLYEIGGDISLGSEILNCTAPDLVKQVHGEYLQAGSELIETNTFAANRLRLAQHGLEDRVAEINREGVRLARESVGKHAIISGSIGPSGLNPLTDEWVEADVRAALREQIELLLDAGVDVLQFETYPYLDELLLAIGEARAIAGKEVVIIAQMMFGDGASPASGESAQEVAVRLMRAGANVIGANCGRGVAATVKAVEALIPAALDTPVSVYPNAGFPQRVDGRMVYLATPEYLADNLVRLAKAGARLLGGCCGTTPDTIRAIRLGVAGIRNRTRHMESIIVRPAIEEKVFKSGGFLESLRHELPVIAEIDPPATLEFQPILDGCRLVKYAGADAVSLAENPLASVKMGNVALASLIRKEFGIQTICHMTCRDRNILGTQSELMGAHALDIQAILAVTGDPTHHAEQTGRSVFDTNSVGLVRLITTMNRGFNANGKSIKGETDFSIGVAFNSAAVNMKAELAKLQRKIDEGARFVMTQPIFDHDRARMVLDVTENCGARVFLGFFPLVSARNALYLHNEVPGVTIPDDLLARITAIEDKAEQRRLGISYTEELVLSLIDEMDGVYLISPFNRADLLAPIIAAIRHTSRGQRLVVPSAKA